MHIVYTSIFIMIPLILNRMTRAEMNIKLLKVASGSSRTQTQSYYYTHLAIHRNLFKYHKNSNWKASLVCIALHGQYTIHDMFRISSQCCVCLFSVAVAPMATTTTRASFFIVYKHSITFPYAMFGGA